MQHAWEIRNAYRIVGEISKERDRLDDEAQAGE
jgi:hypothetical protein